MERVVALSILRHEIPQQVSMLTASLALRNTTATTVTLLDPIAMKARPLLLIKTTSTTNV